MLGGEEKERRGEIVKIEGEKNKEEGRRRWERKIKRRHQNPKFCRSSTFSKHYLILNYINKKANRGNTDFSAGLNTGYNLETKQDQMEL